jgi:hypothetical protein
MTVLFRFSSWYLLRIKCRTGYEKHEIDCVLLSVMKTAVDMDMFVAGVFFHCTVLNSFLKISKGTKTSYFMEKVYSSF